MLHRGGNANLPCKPLASQSGGDRRQQDLDDHVAPERLLAREEYAAHPATAELTLDPVGVTERRLQVRAKFRRSRGFAPRVGADAALEEALPIRLGLVGKKRRQLGGQPWRPRAQLDEPSRSLLVREIERLVEQRRELSSTVAIDDSHGSPFRAAL